MVLWNSVDISLPMRFQIPKGYCEYGVGQYDQVSIKIADTEFLEWFKNMEKILIGDLFAPVESRVNDENSTLSVKYMDGFTQVFDSSNVYIPEGHTLIDCEVDCLVDVDRVYSMNGANGITCKIFQVRVAPVELHFS